MRLNKYKSLILIITMLFFTGCNINLDDKLSELKSNVSDIVSEAGGAVSDYVEESKPLSPHKLAVNTFNEVFELVQEKDTQAIYDMFSEYVKENVDIMPDIENLVNFMEGEVTEIGHVGASNDYSSVRDGETVRAGYSAMSDIKTSAGITYWFNVGIVTANADETQLGLDWIYVLNCNSQTTYRDARIEWREKKIMVSSRTNHRSLRIWRLE